MTPGSAPARRLRPVRAGPALPFVPFPPLHCRAAGRRLCVAAIEGMAGGSCVLLLDGDGAPIGSQVTLPSLVTGLDVVDHDHVVLAATIADHNAAVVELDLEAKTIGWSVEVPLPDDVTRVVQPVAVAGSLELSWQTGLDRSTWWTLEVTDAGAGEARALAFPDLTGDSDTAAAAGMVALARVHGLPQQLDVVWVGRGAQAGVVGVADRVGAATPSIAPVPGGAAVAWDDGRGLRVSRVEPGGSTLTADLAVPLWPDRVVSCDMITDGDHRAAVVWHRGQLDDIEHVTGLAALLDLETWRLSSAVSLDPPGTLHHTGGWVDGRLVLVHGDHQPVVTVFELSP